MCDDDDVAQAKFEELWAALTTGAGDAVSSEPKLLKGTVLLKAQAALRLRGPADRGARSPRAGAAPRRARPAPAAARRRAIVDRPARTDPRR